MHRQLSEWSQIKKLRLMQVHIPEALIVAVREATLFVDSSLTNAGSEERRNLQSKSVS